MTSFSKKLFHSIDLILDKADLHKNDLHFVVREGSDFSRKARKLSFKDTILCILSMAAKPMKEELYDFFDYSIDTPSTSAFVQARSKISPSLFQYLFHSLNQSYPGTKTFKGYHLISVDGSDLHIPIDKNDPDTLYHSTSSNKDISFYHINAAYDILNNRYIDMILQGIHSKNEAEALWMIAERFHEDAIFIGDRGYPTWNAMAHIIECNQHFLMRCKDIHSPSSILRKFHLPDEEFDLDLSITLTTKQSKDIKKLPEKYRFLSSTSTFDFFPEDDPFYTISFRAIRFRLDGSEEYESILTNLSKDDFSADEIKDLYHKRWGIEVSFRHLKYSADLCAVHAKKRQSIKQEIWARMILYNLTFIMIHHITENSKRRTNDKRKHAYSINVTTAIHHCRHYLLMRKRKGGKPPDLEAYISKELLPVRAKRKSLRNVTTKHVICFNYRFS